MSKIVVKELGQNRRNNYVYVLTTNPKEMSPAIYQGYTVIILDTLIKAKIKISKSRRKFMLYFVIFSKINFFKWKDTVNIVNKPIVEGLRKTLIFYLLTHIAALQLLKC